MKNNKSERGITSRKELLNTTVEVLDSWKKICDHAIAAEDKKMTMELQKRALNKISEVLMLSDVKGKGGVIALIKTYNSVIDEIIEGLNEKLNIESEKRELIDLLSYRIQNKMCERLFPDDNTYINDRIQRMEFQKRLLRPTIVSALMEADIVEKTKDFDNVFIYEEDEESLLIKAVMKDLGVENFKAFISDCDAFNLKGEKIISFDEAKISNNDVLILTAPKCIRQLDRSIVDSKNIKNVIELRVFDKKEENRESGVVSDIQQKIMEARNKNIMP